MWCVFTSSKRKLHGLGVAPYSCNPNMWSPCAWLHVDLDSNRQRTLMPEATLQLRMSGQALAPWLELCKVRHWLGHWFILRPLSWLLTKVGRSLLPLLSILALAKACRIGPRVSMSNTHVTSMVNELSIRLFRVLLPPVMPRASGNHLHTHAASALKDTIPYYISTVRSS